MKVNNNNINNSLNITGTKNEKAEKSANGSSSSVNDSDLSASAKVNFSEQAQKINQLKALATPNLDEVREDKVEYFQKLIDEGKYTVDADAVADRLVDEHLIS